jgi:hypothetical protein
VSEGALIISGGGDRWISCLERLQLGLVQGLCSCPTALSDGQ